MASTQKKGGQQRAYILLDPEDKRPVTACINGVERTFERGKGYTLEPEWRDVLERAGYLVSMED